MAEEEKRLTTLDEISEVVLRTWAETCEENDIPSWVHPGQTAIKGLVEVLKKAGYR